MIGKIIPCQVVPFAGNIGQETVSNINNSDPMMKDGMETNAVVITMMILSTNLLRLRAATDPSTIPKTPAKAAAIMPKTAEVFNPSRIISMTDCPLIFKEGPKSNRNAPFR